MKIPKKRFLTFLTIGALNTLLDTFLFTGLIAIFGRNPEKIIILNIISFSSVVLCSFFMNGRVTFKDKGLTKKKLVKYYGSSSFGMILNTIIVIFLMTSFGLGTIVSKIIAACTIVIYNYKMSKNFIFEKNYEK
jgi:putative flippase GtrA